MKERPMIFGAESVNAILAGRETQTRRRANEFRDDQAPHGAPGDRIWVRETWQPNEPQYGGGYLYRADDPAGHIDGGWKSSMFMPRRASRLTLEIEAVRIERLQEISEEDARAEGIQVFPLQDASDPSAWWQSCPSEHQARTARRSFALLWESINGKRAPWDSNPWVWVYQFRRLA